MSDIATFQVGSKLFVQCQREGRNALRVVRDVLTNNVPSWLYPERFAAKLVAEIERRGDGAYVYGGFPDIVTNHPIVQVWCGVDWPMLTTLPEGAIAVDAPQSTTGVVLIQRFGESAHATFSRITSVSAEDAVGIFTKVWE